MGVMGQKLVRYFTFFVCSIVILFILITLILPAAGRVVKEKYIQAPRQVVLTELTSLHHYSRWYPWIQVDPTAEITYRADQKELSWHSAGEKTDDGSYRLVAVNGDSALHFRFTYKGTPPINGAFVLQPAEDGTGTTVIWYMNMKAGWTPWWRFYAAMMNKLTGPMMETGLNNLKIVSEEAGRYSDIPVKEMTIPRSYVATLADTVPQTVIYQALHKLLREIRAFIPARRMQAAGDPMAQFRELSNHTFRVNAGIPVNKAFTPGRVKLLTIPAGTVLTADYRGRYADIQNAYKALSHFATGYTRSSSLLPWETYPDGEVPQHDSTYCHVRVYYPLAH